MAFYEMSAWQACARMRGSEHAQRATIDLSGGPAGADEEQGGEFESAWVFSLVLGRQPPSSWVCLSFLVFLPCSCCKPDVLAHLSTLRPTHLAAAVVATRPSYAARAFSLPTPGFDFLFVSSSVSFLPANMARFFSARLASFALLALALFVSGSEAQRDDCPSKDIQLVRGGSAGSEGCAFSLTDFLFSSVLCSSQNNPRQDVRFSLFLLDGIRTVSWRGETARWYLARSPSAHGLSSPGWVASVSAEPRLRAHPTRVSNQSMGLTRPTPAAVVSVVQPDPMCVLSLPHVSDASPN